MIHMLGVIYAACIQIPYLWGGESHLIGLDCSAWVKRLLIMNGALPNKCPDYNAQGLYDLFSKKSSGISPIKCGSLIFFGESVTKITHVAMAIDSWQLTESAGGGSECITTDISKQKGAGVRIMPINYRNDRVAILWPGYEKIGVP